MPLDAAARTHAGKVRTSNEDAWLSRPAAGLFAVVDGMGGEACGEVAAAIAVQALAEVPDLPELASETVLSQALSVARERILAAADADPSREGMGAVATALRFDDSGASVSVAHVGDSRAYLVTAAGVRVLTHDHLAESVGGRKRQVSRDLGRRDLRGNWVETSRVKVAKGDLLVLSSDGLHDVVTADELGRELVKLRAEARTADAVATRLVSMALSAGGPDNVTVVAVRVGRFRRGVARRSVAAPLAMLATGVVGLATGWFVGTGMPATKVDIPKEVAGVVTLLGAEERVVPSATRSTLRKGGSLRVLGQRLGGGDWSIDVQAGASLQIERAVVALDRELFVQAQAGASVLVRDVRVESGRLRFAVPAGAHVVLEHVSLPDAAALVIEGEGEVSQVGVTVRPAPAEAAPPPVESGPPPAEVEAPSVPVAPVEPVGPR